MSQHLDGDKSVQKLRPNPLTKDKNKDEKDLSPGINETEFCHINFDLDWPRIVKDLAYYLTGTDFL